MSSTSRFLSGAFLAVVLASCASCSKTEPQPSAAAMEVTQLLELIDAGYKKVDTTKCTEFDFGEFKIYRRKSDDSGPIRITFRLIGILPDAKVDELSSLLPTYERRVRDAVIELVSKLEPNQLSEARLQWVKVELTATINRVLQTPALVDVVFSEFSVEAV